MIKTVKSGFDDILDKFTSDRLADFGKHKKRKNESLALKAEESLPVPLNQEVLIPQASQEQESSPSIKPHRIAKRHNLKDLVKVVEIEQEGTEVHHHDTQAKGFNLEAFKQKNLGLNHALKKRLFEQKFVDIEIDRINTLLEKLDNEKKVTEVTDITSTDRLGVKKNTHKKSKSTRGEILQDWRGLLEEEDFKWVYNNEPELIEKDTDIDEALLTNIINSGEPDLENVRNRARYLRSLKGFNKGDKKAFVFFKEGIGNTKPGEFSYNDQKLRDRMVKRAIKKGKYLGKFSSSIRESSIDLKKSKFTTNNIQDLKSKNSNTSFTDLVENSEKNQFRNLVRHDSQLNNSHSDDSVRQLSQKNNLSKSLKTKEKLKELEEAAIAKKNQKNSQLLSAKLRGSSFGNNFFNKIVKTAKNIYYNNQAVSSIKNVKSGNYSDLPFADEMQQRIRGAEKLIMEKAEKAKNKIDSNLKLKAKKIPETETRIIPKLFIRKETKILNPKVIEEIEEDKLDTEFATSQGGIESTATNSQPYLNFKINRRSYHQTSISGSRWGQSGKPNPEITPKENSYQPTNTASYFRNTTFPSSRQMNPLSPLAKRDQQKEIMRVTFSTAIGDQFERPKEIDHFRPNKTSSDRLYTTRKYSSSSRITTSKGISEVKEAKAEVNNFIKDAAQYQEFSKQLSQNLVKYSKSYITKNFKPDLNYLQIFKDYMTEPESKEVMEKAHKIYLMAPPKTRKQILRNCTTTLKQNPGLIKRFGSQRSLKYIY